MIISSVVFFFFVSSFLCASLCIMENDRKKQRVTAVVVSSPNRLLIILDCMLNCNEESSKNFTGAAILWPAKTKQNINENVNYVCREYNNPKQNLRHTHTHTKNDVIFDVYINVFAGCAFFLSSRCHKMR